MKIFSVLVLFLGISQVAIAQVQSIPDTILYHPFQGQSDPNDTFLIAPLGDDLHWVNYDADFQLGFCLRNEPTPDAWFWEGDLGVPDPSSSINFALTSCSYFEDPNQPAANWLILPPLTIPDSTYRLCWRSMPYYGPQYMDGYKVLLSKTNNIPESGVFLDTLFRGAEFVSTTVPYSLNLSHYTFSAGYVHANGYTDTTYFFKDFSEPPSAFFHGRLEPHSVSLAPYVGQTVYIAFLHDSTNDDKLQIDDIVVTNSPVSGVRDFDNLTVFSVAPNPVTLGTYCHWNFKKPEESRLLLRDVQGKLVFERKNPSFSDYQYYLDMQHLTSGVYYCTLLTSSGQSTRKLVKW
jgi:hypothetical protein